MERVPIGNRRSAAQVIGRAVLTLARLELGEVEHGGIRLRLRPSLRIVPRRRGRNPRLLHVSVPSLGLDAFAVTVGELLDDVAEDLVVLWRHYALAPYAGLSPKALELKRRLLESIEELPVVA